MEVLVFGFVLLIVFVLLIANVWAVIDAKLTVTAAAREGARAMVEATPATAAGAARRAIGEVIEGANRSLERVTSTTELPDGAGFERCARVRVRVRAAVPSIALPHIGGLGAPFTVSSTHSEIVDPFRSGLDGIASCG